MVPRVKTFAWRPLRNSGLETQEDGSWFLIVKSWGFAAFQNSGSSSLDVAAPSATPCRRSINLSHVECVTILYVVSLCFKTYRGVSIFLFWQMNHFQIWDWKFTRCTNKYQPCAANVLQFCMLFHCVSKPIAAFRYFYFDTCITFKSGIGKLTRCTNKLCSHSP
jgi:hypothetical protein